MAYPVRNLVATLRQRGDVLACLVEGPYGKQALSEELSVARTTITRALDDLDEWELIVPDGDEVRLTLLGQLVLTVYDDFETTVAAVAAHESDAASQWQTAPERMAALDVLADRLDVLECVQTPREKRTLVAELDTGRSTVDRAIREAESMGLVQRTPTGYTTTTIGQRATALYRATLTTLTDLLDARDILTTLPAECELPPALVTSATLERADDATLYRLLPGVRTRLEPADRIRAVLPALAHPQLLDVCHHRVVRHGATLKLVTDPGLADTLTSAFPGPLAEMAAAATGTFTAAVGDVPPFGLVFTETDAAPAVSLLVYSDHQTVYGALHTASDTALAWAEDYYEHVQDRATETTTDWLDVAESTGGVALSAVADPGRVEREAEGFVQLTAEYFAQHAPAPPATAWRTGFDLVDVHAGYAIERESDCDSDGTEQRLTDVLLARLDGGTDHALLGPPGSGKSTVCQTVACRWYEQGYGAVFYRESGTGATFESPAILGAQLRAAEGQTLVVVEDAMRAEANAIFRVMDEFRGDATVTFLLDARTSEWTDPPRFPTDARLDAYRTEAVETVTMPALDETDCERLVAHFQETTDHEIDIPVAHLLRDATPEPGDDAEPERSQTTQPADLLLVLHRLLLHADPLADEDSRIPTALTEDVHQTYTALRTESALALDVGILVNLLNAAGHGVQLALVYALAEDEAEVETVRDTLGTLEGQIIFTREDASSVTVARTVHEAWSQLFLEHLLDAADTTRAANERFGQCLNALLALADDDARRERSTAAVGGTAPVIERITATPTEWADATTERIFQLGRTRPELAPLFGPTEHPTIELPDACSPAMAPRCARWRGAMYFQGGHPDRAHREFTHAIALVETAEAGDTAPLRAVKASSYHSLGALALEDGDLDAATAFFTHGRDTYRIIDDRRGEANCYSALGSVAGVRGNYERAVACYEQSLTAYREIGVAQQKWTETLTNLGAVVARRGDLDRAENYLERSIDIGRDLERRDALAHAFGNLGELTRLRGDLAQAEDYHKQQLTIARDTGVLTEQAMGLFGLGRIALARDTLDRAAEYIQDGLDICHDGELIQTKTEGYRQLGILARKNGDLGAAEEHLTDALTLARDGGDRYAEGKTLDELGKLAVARAEHEQARKHFMAAIAIYRELGAVRDAVTSLERVAEICETLADPEASLTHYETAATIAHKAAFDVPHPSLSEQRARLADNIPGNGD